MMKTTSFFLFLILMLNLFLLSTPVFGASIEYGTGFEGGTVTQQWNDDLISTSSDPESGGHAWVENDVVRTGTRSYEMFETGAHSEWAYSNWTFSYTDTIHITNFSSWLTWDRTGSNANDNDAIEFFFYDGDINVIRLTFAFTGVDTQFLDFSYWDSGGVETEVVTIAFFEGTFSEFGFNFTANDTVNYFGKGVELTDSPRNVVDNPRIDSLVIRFRPYNWDTVNYYLDDLEIGFEIAGEYGESTQNKEINIHLFDLETGERLYAGGLGTGKAWMVELDKIPNVRLDIRSDLLGGFSYNPTEEYGTTITISDLIFNNGDYHYINLTSIGGFVTQQFDVKHYFDSINYFQFYDGQTYTIYVSDAISGYSGYSNCKTGQTGGGLSNEICTDKRNYVQGESVNIRYKAMDPQSIIDHLYGFPYSGYQIWIYDRNDLGWWWQTDGGKSASQIWDATQDNQYHFQHWDYSDYGNVTGGINGYKLFLAKPYGGLFGSDVFLVEGPNFWITFGDFTAHGNITSISPSEPMLGQFVTIGFEANNNGYLTVKNRLAPDGQELMLTSFMKFDGIATVSKQFWEFGSYELNLYVEDETGANKVDTDYFDITDVNGSFGDFGFGIEFLTVEPERPIAGYDTVFVNYRSMDVTGEIKIVDAREQTTSYGAVVGEKRGVLNISLPPYAAIGVWNVTLTTANNTLYSSFNVVATENNWIEFYRNVYSDQQSFNLKLKHDKKVEIVFLKNGVEMGTDWFLEVDQLTGGVYDVPGDIVQLSPGAWTVEMYEVNNFIKIRLLATDECIVVEVGPGSIEAGYDDIFSIIAGGADSIASGGFGLAFIAIMFILIVIVSLAKYNIKNDTIFFGTICMALFMAYIGWLPIWIVVIAIILSGFLFSSAFSKKLKIGG